MYQRKNFCQAKKNTQKMQKKNTKLKKTPNYKKENLMITNHVKDDAIYKITRMPSNSRQNMQTLRACFAKSF